MSVKILVVDDSEIVRKAFLKTVEISGIEVSDIFQAESGANALQILSRNDVDLMFLDINMPVMDGTELLVKLRAEERFVELPVVIMTSARGQISKAELNEWNVLEYLKKPVSPEKLAQLLQSIVGGS